MHRFVAISVAVLASLSLSTTFAFGAINPFSSKRRGINIMGSSHSSQSSLDQGTASILAPDAGGNGVDSADCGVSSRGSVQLSATKRAGGDSLQSNDESMITSYTSPTSPIKPLAHYIFLVHGWLGNDLEMAYLSKAFQNIISPPQNGETGIDGSVESSGVPKLPSAKRVRRSGSYQSRLINQQDANDECDVDTEIVVHSVKCNVGRTSDGIRKGGRRLANEIVDFIRSDVESRIANCGENTDENNEDDATHVTYSIVGNSLGGLYARYAVSLLPYHLHLKLQQQGSTKSNMLNLHPSIFCTTATPHLGVSKHTYLPIPRIAETIIGTGLGTTGRDLFRLNSEKDLASMAAGGIMNAAAGSVRRFARRGENDQESDRDDDDEMECIISNMCTQEKYLTPLRNFRQRIAYANAYGTDFQVPTLTAAFLNEKSGVGHFVESSRQIWSAQDEQKRTLKGSAEGKARNDETGKDYLPFIVAIVRTEQQSHAQLPISNSKRGADELLRMSQCLDALGWTKVFIDVRDRIPVPGLATPAWLRPNCGSLDDLIRERSALGFTSLNTDENTSAESSAVESEPSAPAKPPTNIHTSECVLTSQELAQSTQTGDTIHFPLGHTVMVANSKSERYSQINSQGRPVMDRLAQDLTRMAQEFE